MQIARVKQAAGWLVTGAAAFVAAGCASHPRGDCGLRCAEIESAMHILEYPTQRLTILRRIASYDDLNQHEQTYLVNAIFVGGFSEDVADALVTLVRNPVSTPQTRNEIRKKLKTSRLLGRSERRVIEVLTKADRELPPATRAAS